MNSYAFRYELPPHTPQHCQCGHPKSHYLHRHYCPFCESDHLCLHCGYCFNHDYYCLKTHEVVFGVDLNVTYHYQYDGMIMAYRPCVHAEVGFSQIPASDDDPTPWVSVEEALVPRTPATNSLASASASSSSSSEDSPQNAKTENGQADAPVEKAEEAVDTGADADNEDEDDGWVSFGRHQRRTYM
ncbi:hypothetical protein ONZ45_g15088 [Pleurotus djamor]|nr:hypothetical protein ONZ45_g15088 [Pleurotus djamor]